MDRVPLSYKPRLYEIGAHKLRTLCLVLLLASWLPAGVLLAQEEAKQPAAGAPSKTQAQTAQPKAKKENSESKISPKEAQELFRSVDEILEFASKQTKLPILQPIKRELANRQQVREYITWHISEDRDPQRLQRSEATLKKFGLLPPDFDLRAFLLDVLQDQVAGYYDPKTKTVYLLDWVAPEVQRPVLAHELTHALQDQNFGLEGWLKAKPVGEEKKLAGPEAKNSGKKQDDEDESQDEPSEEQAAREAVSEGQATAVLIDYILQPSGRSVADSPTMVEIFKRSTMERTEDSPLFSKAPLYLKESLIFSYTYGLSFVQELLVKGGKERAFARAFKDPPRDTREIMEPKTYLAGEHVPPLELPRLAPILDKSYETYDRGTIGQLDVYLLLKQFGDQGAADKLSSKWRGGVYYLGRKKDAAQAGKKPGEKSSGAPGEGKVPRRELALLYLSRWASNQDAASFAADYRSWLPRRYRSVEPAPANPKAESFAERVANSTKWTTSEGPAYVETWGEMVLVMEGFDDATAARIRDAVLGHSTASTQYPVPGTQWRGLAAASLGN